MSYVLVFGLGLYRYKTRSSAIAEGPRDASCQLKSCQLPRNSAETTYSIQTAGLAFGGTGLCSYRVRGVGSSFAEHLTVESYKIIISLQSYFCYWYSITHSLFHSRLKSFLFSNPPYRSLSFVSFKIHYMDFPDCLLLLLSISVFLLFSFFSVFRPTLLLVVGSVR